MLRLRPVREDDLDGLMTLAELATFGLTTLPKDRELMAGRIAASLESFARTRADKPGNESYLFVMEDTERGRLAGTCGVLAKVGGFDPFYTYRIETTVHESKMLGVRKEIRALHLVREHSGPTEIGSLFLHPDYRRSGVGRALALPRFLFIAEHRRRFEPTVIAEMRGVIDDRGRSPFWDALGRHFFDIEFARADALSIVNKQFIGELMPEHPIYIPLLPPEAQQVIGQVHENTRPALKLLASEGFARTDMVDIFEAGPILACERDRIRTVHRSRRARIAAVTDDPIDPAEYIIGNTRLDFRACRGALTVDEEGAVRLPRRTAEALEVAVGDTVRYATLRPEPTEEGQSP